MATTKAKNTTPKALPEGGRPRSKAELAAELVRVLPGALKGPEDTPERLAKRCTVAELERMLTEARTPLPQTGLGFASDPAPDALMGALADDREARTALAARSDKILADAKRPAWLVKGAKVHVVASGEEPEFYGVVDDVNPEASGEPTSMVCVIPTGESAGYWVEQDEVQQDTRDPAGQPERSEARTVGCLWIANGDTSCPCGQCARERRQDSQVVDSVKRLEPSLAAAFPTAETRREFLADQRADVTLPEGTPGVAGVDDLLALVKQEGIDWEAMASDEARAEEEAAMAKKAREEARRAGKPAPSPSGPTRPQRSGLPPVGTVLKHKDQTATVTAQGVEFAGVTYQTLSAAGSAASRALGQKDRVNGWDYWGLTKKERAPKLTAAHAQLEKARALWRLILDEKHEGEEWTDGYLTGAVCALARFLGVTTEALKGGETPAPAPRDAPGGGNVKRVRYS